MSTQNGSNKGMVPEARAAMDRFKMEAASDVAAAKHKKLSGPCLHTERDCKAEIYKNHFI